MEISLKTVREINIEVLMILKTCANSITNASHFTIVAI